MARSDMYRKLPFQGGDARSVAEIVNNLVEGKSNNTGSFSTTVSTTTTTLSDERIGFYSVILFMPLDHNQSQEKMPLCSYDLIQSIWQWLCKTTNHYSHQSKQCVVQTLIPALD